MCGVWCLVHLFSAQTRTAAGYKIFGFVFNSMLQISYHSFMSSGYRPWGRCAVVVRCWGRGAVQWIYTVCIHVCHTCSCSCSLHAHCSCNICIVYWYGWNCIKPSSISTDNRIGCKGQIKSVSMVLAKSYQKKWTGSTLGPLLCVVETITLSPFNWKFIRTLPCLSSVLTTERCLSSTITLADLASIIPFVTPPRRVSSLPTTAVASGGDRSIDDCYTSSTVTNRCRRWKLRPWSVTACDDFQQLW